MFGANFRIPLEDGDIMVGADERGRFIKTSESLRRKTAEPWKFSMVAKLVGRNIGYRIICNHIKDRWHPMGDYRVIDLQNNFFMMWMPARTVEGPTARLERTRTSLLMSEE
ncbi:hypothetical protein Sjap_017634 [Stephania japonica]|uniref:Uncharacterized protein n=1 Tax=Stephania japonica TaxID=461633 RepID=A0AAP0I6I3_9MAGN